MSLIKKLFSKKEDPKENNTLARPDNAPGFSHIDSLEKASQLETEGRLEKLLLFPPEFGGEAIAQNTIFVPVGLSQVKQQLTQTLIRYFQEGLISNLEVSPEYKGASVIPSRITFVAKNSSGEAVFTPSINIW